MKTNQLKGRNRLTNLIHIVFFITLFLLPVFSKSQNFKTQVKFVDVEEEHLSAAFQISSVTKTDFDNLVSKINSYNAYVVTNEFFDQKSIGNITMKSNNKLGISDFESFLKQLGIPTVSYNGKEISSQEIHLNHKPVNKTEVLKREPRH